LPLTRQQQRSQDSNYQLLCYLTISNLYDQHQLNVGKHRRFWNMQPVKEINTPSLPLRAI
jgi:hypothetical protein